MTIVFIILAAMAALAVVVALQPNEFRVARSAIINAPPAAVFDVVNDYRKWNDWSPWAKLDPHAKNSYSGPATGVGASFTWEGNAKVGAGTSTITESKPYELIRERLDFLKPFRATNTVEFTFKAEGAQTVITWTMFGKNTFISKAMGLVINCNKMVGGFFDRGLANLKTLVEKGSS